MSKKEEANKIVSQHVLWSMGAGLMPIPLLDIVAVTSMQMDMLKQLAALYDVDHEASGGKRFASALTGGTFARIGASAVKSIPGVGTAVGMVSMPILSGASTYAVGKVAIGIFESGGDLLTADLEPAKGAYHEAFERGKRYVYNLGRKRPDVQGVLQSLEKLGELRERDFITEEEFETQKQKLLARL